MSHYLRCIALAKQYNDHEILFAYSEKYDPFVKKAGYGSFKVETFNAEEVMKCIIKFDFSWLNYAEIEKVFLSQITALKDYKPYLVIGDTAPSLKMAAEMAGIKYICLMNGYMSKYYDGVRPVSRTHYSYEYVNKLPPRIGNFITKFAEAASFKVVHKPFRSLRKKYGLRVIHDYLSELEGDENLICDEMFLFPQKGLPQNYKIIGPLLYSTNLKEDELLNTLDPKKPNICVCLGSSGTWENLNFLSEQKYAFVNIIVAGDINRTLTGAHIYHKDFINLNEILPTCSFMICHGGNGTIYEGLKHNIFMLCITSHFEQEWNVKRLEQLNLGLLINDSPAKYVDEKLQEIVHVIK